MKKLLLLALVLVMMFSCTPKMYSFSSVFDYRQFTKEGFFITESNSVSFKYQPIGSVTSCIVSGVSNDPKTSTEKRFDPFYTAQYANATPEAAITLLAKKCKSLGANGVINLRIRQLVINKQFAFEAAGMAINVVE